VKKYRYFSYPPSLEKNIRDLKTKKSSYWEKLGTSKVISLANFTMAYVPSYKSFLEKSGFSLKKIKDLKGFQALPLASKSSYLKSYPYKDLFPKGYLDKITTVSSTSGSTGEPFYFPRGEEADSQYEYVAEVFLKNQFEIDSKRTLAINGFGLGIWIGGIFTYKVFNKIAAKGYRLALAPTGTNKEIFLKTFAKMADLFDQVILMGYPPFIKDVVDEARAFGIDWEKYSIKVMTATEGYSEKFREYLIKKLGIKNRYSDILNIYGSVELGTMSHETPLANLIRKIAAGNKRVFRAIFPGATEIPTLAQFYPHIVYFEEVDGEVVASGFGSSFPLLRYRFHDSGSVVPFEVMIQKLKKLGINIYKEAREAKIVKSIFKLPFVYVYGRSDFVVILRGANIYPENVRAALLEDSIEDSLTGKFCMLKKENRNFQEYLEVNIELKKGINKSISLTKKVSEVILQTLRNKNSEFNNSYTTEGKKLLTPKCVLFPYEHPKYFKQGIKQNWVKK